MCTSFWLTIRGNMKVIPVYYTSHTPQVADPKKPSCDPTPNFKLQKHKCLIDVSLILVLSTHLNVILAVFCKYGSATACLTHHHYVWLKRRTFEKGSAQRTFLYFCLFAHQSWRQHVFSIESNHFGIKKGSFYPFYHHGNYLFICGFHFF